MTDQMSGSAATHRGQSWIVLWQDAKGSVTVQGHKRVFVGMVLDADSGLILGGGVGPDARTVIVSGLRDAVSQSEPPATIVCQPGGAAQVESVVDELGLGCLVVAADLPAEAEEILDTMLADLSGYRASHEPPSAQTWRALMEAAVDYCEVKPWVRIPDTIALPMELAIGKRRVRYRAVVLGQAQVEFGLWLVPDGSPPISQLAGTSTLPAGSLGMTLMASPDSAVLTRRAHRFGWPPKTDRIPFFFSAHESGGGEPNQEQADHLLLAMAAVQAFDRADHRSRLMGSLKGRVRLPDDRFGSFRLAPAEKILEDTAGRDPWAVPAAPGPVSLDVHSGVLRNDLLPQGATVNVGAVAWDEVPRLRAQAELQVDSPVPQRMTEGGLPVVAIACGAASGRRLARRLREEEPLGLIAMEGDDEVVLVLLCRQQIYGLITMPAAAPETARFRSRLASSGGDHALLVASFAGPRPSRIFGLFECHLDSPAPPRGRRPPPKRPKPGRRR